MNNQHKPVRVRFAPSPTGHLHIGGLRAALFNWLFARHTTGTFLLRIEDTDLERSKPEYVDAILDAFAWVAISADEPIVIQSQQIAYHEQLVKQLLDSGKAYRCYCTPQDVAARQSKRLGLTVDYVQYDGYCKTNVFSHDNTAPGAVRFARPAVDHVTFVDLICGSITFAMDQLDDFIITRSDGRPMYNFAVVADDARAGITHIIRGEEHLSNTPKQILLYEALGFPVPDFAHAPLILSPSGAKLSKRDAATSVIEYKRMGYLPDALVNYLVRLGWSHGDQEIFSRDELIQFFSLDQIGRKGAIFDQQKLDWINSVYIRAASDEDLLARIIADVDSALLTQLNSFTHIQIISLIALYKERVKTLQELAAELRLVHDGPATITAEDKTLWLVPSIKAPLSTLIARYDELPAFTAPALSECAKSLCKELHSKLVSLAQPMRLALVGKTASPGIFELLAVVGKHTSIARLRELETMIQE